MPAPINAVGAAGLALPTPGTQTAGKAVGPDFASALGDAINAAGEAEKTAEDAATRFANGEPGLAIDQVMIASEKASISLRYAVALKNRAVDAYRELMNTPV